MQPSNDALGHRAELDDRWERDGYLYFQGVLDPAAVARTRDGVVEFLREEGVAEQDGPAGPVPPVAVPGRDAANLGPHPPALHRRRLWERLAGHPSVQALVTAVLGPEPVSIPIAQYQFKTPVPVGTPWANCHQDHFYNPGLCFRTFWIPLVPVDERLGGLALAAGMHRDGVRHDTARAGAPLDPHGVPGDAWRRADYRPGDVVIFHGLTPHLGLPNVDPSRLRLSVDIRFQTADDPMPVAGIVRRATARTLEIDDERHGAVEVEIGEATVVRTDLAERTTPDSLVGRRVLCAVDPDGTLLLVRTVA